MAGTYEPIASTTLGSDAVGVTFSGIAPDWTDLRLIATNVMIDRDRNYQLNINGDSGSNYSFTQVGGNGSSASSTRFSNFTSVLCSLIVGYYTGPGDIVVDFMNYANTNVYKTFLSTHTSNASSYKGIEKVVGLWRSTSAITSISIGASSGALTYAGATFTLFGIKAAANG